MALPALHAWLLASDYYHLPGIVLHPIGGAFCLCYFLRKKLATPILLVIFAGTALLLIYGNTKLHLAREFALSVTIGDPHEDKKFLSRYLPMFTDVEKDKEQLRDAFMNTKIHCNPQAAEEILNFVDVSEPEDFTDAIFYGCYDIYHLLAPRIKSFTITHHDGNFTDGYLAFPLAVARYEIRKGSSEDEKEQRYAILMDFHRRHPDLSEQEIQQLRHLHTKLLEIEPLTNKSRFSPEILFLDRYLLNNGD